MLDGFSAATGVRRRLLRVVTAGKCAVPPVLEAAQPNETPLPTLFAEYKGFSLATIPDLRRIAMEISGVKHSKDLAQLLQRRLHELAHDNPIRVVVCPECASKDLSAERGYDGYSESDVYFVMCQDCNWGTARKVRTEA